MPYVTEYFTQSLRTIRATLVLFLALGGLWAGTFPLLAQEKTTTLQPRHSDPVWQAEYWNNVNLSGKPVVQNSAAELTFNWSDGAPDAAVNADRFAARFTRYLYLEAGTYRFTANSDDGVRVYLNGRRIINGWFNHTERGFNVTVKLPSGHHLVQVLYYDNVGAALLNFNWTLIALDGGNNPGQPGVWRGEYFNNKDLSGSPALVRDDAQVDFAWGKGAPADGVNADGFSVRWTATPNLAAGNYRFKVTVDDGARLWVGDKLIIDKWRVQAPTTYTGEVTLPAGATPVRLEYYEEAEGASIKLSWERTDLPLPQATAQPTAQPTPTALPGSITNWRGEYFSNRDLTGAPALLRDDREINFNWGGAAPANGLLADNFSARWTRVVDLPAGYYRFSVTVDDGARLWVNNKLVIDSWREGGAATFTGEINLPGGGVPLRLEYFEASGLASIQLGYQRLDQANTPPPSDRWRAEFFNNPDLAGAPVVVRDDAQIDFAWEGAPANGVDADNFSARWTRTLRFDYAGSYRFRVTVDDGVRLWVNNKLIIDNWRDQGTTSYSGEINLPAGDIPIRLEFYDRVAGAVIRLSWEGLNLADSNNNNSNTSNINVNYTSSNDGGVGKWRAEYFNNRDLSGTAAVSRDDDTINFNWGSGSPISPTLGVDNFSVRWRNDVGLGGGRYEFTTSSDGGVRLFVDDQLVIDSWRDEGRVVKYTVELGLGQGRHTLRLEYVDTTGASVVRLDFRRLPSIGNLITCVPPQPKNYAWIKLYRLDGNNQWYSMGRGIGSVSANGYLKIDGLPVDVGRFGNRGEPYRIEQWVESRVVRSTGNFQTGEAEFLLRPYVDSATPWGC